jgi:hypothetical protein
VVDHRFEALARPEPFRGVRTVVATLSHIEAVPESGAAQLALAAQGGQRLIKEIGLRAQRTAGPGQVNAEALQLAGRGGAQGVDALQKERAVIIDGGGRRGRRGKQSRRQKEKRPQQASAERANRRNE